MELFNITVPITEILLLIAVGLLGWVLKKVNKLDREVGVVSEKLDNKIFQYTKEAKETDRRLDSKQDKD